MCLFTSALGMFTVTTSYQCIIASLDQNVFVQCSPHYVYSYDLTMTMMLSNVSSHRYQNVFVLGMFTDTT